MSITFVSGNKNKLEEFRAIMGSNVTIDSVGGIDLVEIQSVSVEPVVRAKIKTAFEKIKQPCFVEDTGLFINDINGFPGALIKHYSDTLGYPMIAQLHKGSMCLSLIHI